MQNTHNILLAWTSNYPMDSDHDTLYSKASVPCIVQLILGTEISKTNKTFCYWVKGVCGTEG